MVRKLLNALNNFDTFNVLLLGDFIVDNYITGSISRISSEAPVPILRIQKEDKMPGGAGNAALNLVGLGGKVSVMGCVGSDSNGAFLRKTLGEKNIDTSALIEITNFATPVKNRAMSSNQQLLRIDKEEFLELSEELEDFFIARVQELLDSFHVVAISDYGQGFLTDGLLSAVIESANLKNIPVIIDPRGTNFAKYRGATLIKPNFKEARLAAALAEDADLSSIAEKLLKVSGAKHLMVTRSEDGMSLFNDDGSQKHFATPSCTVRDVTGAGDTALAVIASAFANKLTLDDAANLANVAGGITVKNLGCFHITISDIAKELFKKDSYNKIFEEDHLFAIQEVLSCSPFIVLGVYSSDGLSTELFKNIKKLSSNKLVVYIRDTNPDEEFLSILSSLGEVSFIILKSDGLESLCEKLKPEHTFIIEKDKLLEQNLALSV